MPWAEDYHASVFIRGPNSETVLIIQDWKNPPLWKFPGGKKDPGEKPIDTAIREVEEETGLILDRANLSLVTERHISGTTPGVKNKHTKYFFIATVDSFKGLVPEGKDGERTGIFRFVELEKMVDIHGDYFRFYLHAKEAGLV